MSDRSGGESRERSGFFHDHPVIAGAVGAFLWNRFVEPRPPRVEQDESTFDPEVDYLSEDTWNARLLRD